MMSHPCFLAVDMNERMTAKSAAEASQRKPPEIFCLTFIMRPSRVFNEQERRHIQQKIELGLPTAEDSLVDGRLRFLAQLRAARQSLTIFMPERDSDDDCRLCSRTAFGA